MQHFEDHQKLHRVTHHQQSHKIKSNRTHRQIRGSDALYNHLLRLSQVEERRGPECCPIDISSLRIAPPSRHFQQRRGFGSQEPSQGSIFPFRRRTCSLSCEEPSGTFDSSGHSTTMAHFRSVPAKQAERKIAHEIPYRHEITVLTTIPANFLAISAIQIPINADELRGCHYVVLISISRELKVNCRVD